MYQPRIDIFVLGGSPLLTPKRKGQNSASRAECSSTLIPLFAQHLGLSAWFPRHIHNRVLANIGFDEARLRLRRTHLLIEQCGES